MFEERHGEPDHTSGRISATGLSNDIGWVVVGNGIADLSENELELWYASQDRLSVAIQLPDGTWIGEVLPGQYIENLPLSNGTLLSVYNELYHPSNGANYISVYLSPPLVRGLVSAGVAAGEWTVRLRGLEIRDGTYHGWIERDDPRRLGTVGTREQWNFPSFFAQRSVVDKSSVTSLACGQNVVSVANLDEVRGRIHITSSQRPTRDGRPKPDLCAPGTDIVAAKGFAAPTRGCRTRQTVQVVVHDESRRSRDLSGAHEAGRAKGEGPGRWRSESRAFRVHREGSLQSGCSVTTPEPQWQ